MELYAKYIKQKKETKSKPDFADKVDYYFDTYEEFENGVSNLLKENNNDLSQKTIGFGDSVEGIGMTFFGTEIVATPKTLYGNNLKDFSDTFMDCASLTTISKDLFANCPAENLETCFAGCKALKEIPEDLFQKSTGITRLRETFATCTSLEKIPAKLFSNLKKVETFLGCFHDCTSLKEIPSELFKDCTEVTSFEDCFESCKALTSVPQGLFSNNVNVKEFNSCFGNCTSLVTVPQDLFDNCKKVVKFSSCFSECSSITSSLPDAWNKEKFPEVVERNAFAYAENCNNAANYSEVPESFK